MLSIIIPALNEEKYLGLLLECIKNQGYKDYEIIVADAGSKDKTVEIAKKYGCKVVPGGLPGKGRNEGTRVAKGDLLLFLDADCILPDDFLNIALKEFYEKKFDFASFGLLPYNSDKAHTMAFNVFYNWYIYALGKTLPHAAMGIMAKKDLFMELNGFDETITLAEDMDLARRAQKIASFGIIRSVKIFISDRRFKKDGWVKTALKYLFCEWYMIFLGPVKSDIFKYKFGHYENKNKKNV